MLPPSHQLSKIQIAAIYEKFGPKAQGMIDQFKDANLVYLGSDDKSFHGKSIMLSAKQFKAIINNMGSKGADLLYELASVELGYDGHDHDHPNIDNRFFSKYPGHVFESNVDLNIAP